MRLVNLTGHRIFLEDRDGRQTLIVSLGQRARVSSRPQPLGEVKLEDGLVIPLFVQAERKILDLPDPVPGVLYVVSGIVADVAQRDDVWAIGRKVAKNGGAVEAGRALIRYEKG